jgi:hypothetical protein
LAEPFRSPRLEADIPVVESRSIFIVGEPFAHPSLGERPHQFDLRAAVTAV